MEQVLPEIVGENRDVLVASDNVVMSKTTAQERFNLQNVKQIRRAFNSADYAGDAQRGSAILPMRLDAVG